MQIQLVYLIGIELDEDDTVVGMEVFVENTTLLVVTENGFGKRTELDEYKVQTRGGKGVLTYRVTEKTGKIAGMKLVLDEDDIMLISSDGTIIRLKVDDVSLLGRATQGVTLMRMDEESKLVSVARVAPENEDENAEGEGEVDEVEAEGEATAEELDT